MYVPALVDEEDELEVLDAVDELELELELGWIRTAASLALYRAAPIAFL